MEIFLHEAASFRGAAERAHRLLDGLGPELIEISTNLRILSLAWEDEFGLYLGAVLTLLSGRFGSGLIASSYPYERLALPYGSTPLTDPLMGSATFQIVHDGAERDRIEKAQLLGEWDAARRFLRFCWEGRDKSRNCGRCQKCITTLLSFRLAGVELSCFDAPVLDEDLHQVIRSMKPAGLRLEAPQLLLRRADQLSLEDDWVTWLRQRYDREREHPGAVYDSSSDASDTQCSAVVPLATGDTRPPLFVVNTVAAAVTDFQFLSSRLGPDQPFYVLQPLVAGAATPLPRTIDSMARRCLHEIGKVQPHGPFLIGGRSFGAVVAYELAVQLEAAGETVALFIALDSLGPLWRTRHLANGVIYDPVMNAARVRAQADGMELGDVFSDMAAADSFTRWLREPAFEHHEGDVSRYVYAVYLQRPDLQRAFPLGEHEGGTARAGLVRWAAEHGRSEMGMQPSLLPASSPQPRRAPPTADPRLRSRRRHAVERALDWVNFVTRGTNAQLAARRRDEIIRIAGESTVRYRAGRLDATVLVVRPDQDAEGLPGAPLDRWYGLELGGLEEHVVVGSPHTMLSEPVVASVAECVERRIVAGLETAGHRHARTS
jgi:thioesterase domain-containing protein